MVIVTPYWNVNNDLDVLIVNGGYGNSNTILECKFNS